MSYTCGQEGYGPITAEKIREAMSKVGLLPKSDQWIVINPQGQAFEGTVEQVLPVLMGEHPMIKMPLTMSFDRRG